MVAEGDVEEEEVVPPDVDSPFSVSSQTAHHICSFTIIIDNVIN